MDCSPPGSSVHGDYPGKNIEVGCCSLFQRVFPTQGLDSCLLLLLHWQADSLPLLPPGNPLKSYSSVQSLSRVQLFATPWTIAYQASPSMGFSGQENWSGLPFPSPGDLPDPGIEPRYLT